MTVINIPYPIRENLKAFKRCKKINMTFSNNSLDNDHAANNMASVAKSLCSHVFGAYSPRTLDNS